MKINLPEIDKEAMINSCISGVKDNCRKKRLLESKKNILKTSNIYYAALAKVALSKINANQKFVGKATKDDMIFLYDKRLVKSKRGKEFHDAIIAGAPWGKCPICNYNLADTVDHYLAKTIYYQFAVTLENLVPMCIVYSCGNVPSFRRNGYRCSGRSIPSDRNRIPPASFWLVRVYSLNAGSSPYTSLMDL